MSAPAARSPVRRVALVTLAWHGHGGIERCVQAEALALASQGVEVHVFSAAFEGDAPPGVAFHRVALPRLPWALRLALFAWRAPARVRAAGAFDIVHAHTVYLGVSDAATAHSVHRVAVAVDPSAPGWARVAAYLRGFPPLSVALADATYRRARTRVAIARVVAQELRACYGPQAQPTELLYCGVEGARFRPPTAGQKRRLRQQLDLGDGAWALFCGWNWRRKGLDLLLQAMVSLPQARLVVLGEDPLEGAHFRQLAVRLGLEGRVRFAGAQGDPSPWFQAADLFAFPTRYEPFGMVVTEAMACGLPVLVPANAGAAEVIRAQRGMQVLPAAADASAWAQAWGALLRQPARAIRIGAANRRAMLRFTWRRHGRELMALYRRIQARP